MIKNIGKYLKNYIFEENGLTLFQDETKKTKISSLNYNNNLINVFTNEFWTSKQRQSNSLHEISYRACFKAQLPRFFIKLLSNENDIVYDPFAGRGTTLLEAALLNRNIIANDINPLSKILLKPRLFIPSLDELAKRLQQIKIDYNYNADIDLSMFYHPKTEGEIVSLKKYLFETSENDYIDDWIQMIATNRLTGHSKGFFSVYTLPPNQAILPERQKELNKKKNQIPEYRDVKNIILRKSKSLLKNINSKIITQLKNVGENALFLNNCASKTKTIKDNSIQLTVTSPPFLDVVQYADDNWLRCWINNIDIKKIESKITITKKVDDWSKVMQKVFNELYRITKNNGYVAFEVGEVRNGKVKLEEYVVPLGIESGFNCIGIMINSQVFSKTSNCWGVSNNKKGTNTNRIVLFQKEEK